MINKIFLASAVALSALSAQADIKPLLQVGIDTGGDKLADISFQSGDDDTIKAGGGLTIEGGAAISTGDKLESHILLGYKSDSVDASNGDIGFTRVYITALQNYNFGKVTVGAGGTYHISPTLESSGVVGRSDIDFDSAFGGVVQASYNFNQHSSLGLRATAIDYKEKKFGKKISGNSVGLVYTHKF